MNVVEEKVNSEKEVKNDLENNNKSSKKDIQTKDTLKKLLGYVSEYKVQLFIVFILVIVSTLISVFGPKISGEAITKLSEGAAAKISGVGTGIDFDAVFGILSKLVILYSVSALATCVSSYLMTGMSVKVTYRLREEISQKISRLPLKYFNKSSYGEVLSCVTNDVDMMSSTLTQSINQIISSVIMLVGTLYMMFSISWEMTLLSFAILPVSVIFVALIAKKAQTYFKDYQEHLGHINGHIEEMYSGHKIMKAFNGEQDSINKFDNYNNVMYNTSWKSQFISGLIAPIMSLSSNLMYISMCVMGGYLAIKKGMDIGSISAFIAYTGQFMSPLVEISQVSSILQQTLAASDRVFKFFAEEEEVQDSENCLEIGDQVDAMTRQNTVCIKGDVSFSDVCFGYDDKNKIIDNFSLNVESGQTVAIVGETGAGKTTILKLLMRFYELNSGSISIDGHDIREYKKSELRALFGAVFQDAWLYNDTIMENIRYGKLDASDEEVIEAARLAEVEHFVLTLPDGYKTMINEEVDNLSQGQKQLITIARAILYNPKILILDEATSSVDTRTEINIQNAMKNLIKDRTSFIVAHRLSTIRNADVVIVMKDGKIVEKGTHDSLMNKEGVYFNMYNSQFLNVD